MQVAGDIGKGAPDIAGEQLEEFIGAGSVATDAEFVVEKDGDDLGTVEQVAHIVVHPRQLIQFRLLLGIHRLQLFVERLHLFPRGGQLFVGRLQFFVGRLQLLISGSELFLRGLHLLAGRLQLFAHFLELLLHFGKSSAAGAFRATRSLLFQGHDHISKDDHHHPPQGFGFGNRLHSDIDALRAVLGPDLKIFDGDRFFLPQRFLEGAAQIKTEPFPGHGENIPVGLARGRLQIFTGPAADIKDIPLVVDKHSGRRKVLQQQMIRKGLEINDRFHHG